MGGWYVVYPLTLTPFYPSWKPNAFQKEVRAFSRIFLKNLPIAAPLLHHFTPSEQILSSLLHIFTPFAAQLLRHFTPQSYIVLAPILEGCRSWTHILPQLVLLNLQTIKAWPTLDGQEVRPLNKLPPHSYIILPPPPEQITPKLLHHFTPLGSPALISFYPL